MADLLNDNSIFYTTTCNGCKYPITIIGEHSSFGNKDELPEVLFLLEAYRESLKGGVEIISHTYNNDMGEIRFDHPLRRFCMPYSPTMAVTIATWIAYGCQQV